MRPICLLTILIFLALGGCRAGHPPADKVEGGAPELALPYQARYLSGLTIVLDPGHGGDIGAFYDKTGFKRGPTGLREAEVNLRTAEALQTLLVEAGATVIMTREADIDVPMPERTRIANDAGADLFLSIHHNHSTRETANFASVWYHNDGEDRPASLDLARYLANALVREMKPSEPQYSGVYSDTLMYDEGFAVLRDTGMTAVLAECSFYSNRDEEARLRDPAYNARMAHALLVGLAEWAANGVPRWHLERPDEAAKAGAFKKATTDGASPAKAATATESFIVVIEDGMKETWGNADARVRRVDIMIGSDKAPWALEGKRLKVWFRPDQHGRLLNVRFENRGKNSSITGPTLVP